MVWRSDIWVRFRVYGSGILRFRIQIGFFRFGFTRNIQNSKFWIKIYLNYLKNTQKNSLKTWVFSIQIYRKVGKVSKNIQNILKSKYFMHLIVVNMIITNKLLLCINISDMFGNLIGFGFCSLGFGRVF